MVLWSCKYLTKSVNRTALLYLTQVYSLNARLPGFKIVLSWEFYNVLNCMWSVNNKVIDLYIDDNM